MSRLFIVASLLTAFTSFASADSPAPRFAQPPPATRVASADRDVVIDRAKVRAKLAANRADNLARFRAYQAAGVFPHNTYQPGKLNVWIDEDGRICAAATIIKASGQAALVARIGEQDNFIKLADVRSGPLMDWILTSGLTQDEIAAIQEPFDGPDGRRMPMRVVRSWDAEDARLRAKYKQVDAQIVNDQARSLDAATDRLIRTNPALAKQLIGA
jgi:hypothetical protein